MLIQVIHENAESTLLKTLLAHQGRSSTRNVYQCRFSSLGLPPIDADSVILYIKDHLADRSGKLLYADDGDLFIQWDGVGRDIVHALDSMLMDYYEAHTGLTAPDDICQHYDFHAHGEELRMECRRKLGVFKTLLPEPDLDALVAALLSEEPEPLEAPQEAQAPTAPHFSLSQRATLLSTIQERHLREEEQIEILIVEDHSFSRKLLYAALGKRFICHQARSGAEAIEAYSAHAPNIVFLDIELPDIDGHTLAQLFRREDAGAYIVMVTANHYAKDVELARTNRVQGFIAKPYNKQKLFGSIDHYLCQMPQRSHD